MKLVLTLTIGVANAWVIWPDLPNGTYGAAVAPPVRDDPDVLLKWEDVFTKQAPETVQDDSVEENNCLKGDEDCDETTALEEDELESSFLTDHERFPTGTPEEPAPIKAQPVFGFYIPSGAVPFRHRRPTSGRDRYTPMASDDTEGHAPLPPPFVDVAGSGPAARARRATVEVPGILTAGTWYPWDDPDSVARIMVADTDEGGDEKTNSPKFNLFNTTANKIERLLLDVHPAIVSEQRDLSVANPEKSTTNIVRDNQGTGTGDMTDHLLYPSSIGCGESADILSGVDYHQAKEDLFDYCNIANPEGDRVDVAIHGNAAVYVCNYSEAFDRPTPETCSEKEYEFMEEFMDKVCGKGIPAWVESGADKRVYGRALRGMDICGDFVSAGVPEEDVIVVAEEYDSEDDIGGYKGPEPPQNEGREDN